jgi:hypothetical protein
MNELKIILINLLNDYVQIINEALLLNEDIDISWLFVRKAIRRKICPTPHIHQIQKQFY